MFILSHPPTVYYITHLCIIQLFMYVRYIINDTHVYKPLFNYYLNHINQELVDCFMLIMVAYATTRYTFE